MDHLLIDNEDLDYGAVLDPCLANQCSRGRWMARLTLSFGMMGGLLALATVPSLRNWRMKVTRWFGLPDHRSTVRPFSEWCAGVMGRSQPQVIERLGKPHAVIKTARDDDSAVWYYRYNSSRQSAVALSFAHGCVTRIEHLGGS